MGWPPWRRSCPGHRPAPCWRPWQRHPIGSDSRSCTSGDWRPLPAWRTIGRHNSRPLRLGRGWRLRSAVGRRASSGCRPCHCRGPCLSPYRVWQDPRPGRGRRAPPRGGRLLRRGATLLPRTGELTRQNGRGPWPGPPWRCAGVNRPYCARRGWTGLSVHVPISGRGRYAFPAASPASIDYSAHLAKTVTARAGHARTTRSIASGETSQITIPRRRRAPTCGRAPVQTPPPSHQYPQLYGPWRSYRRG